MARLHSFSKMASFASLASLLGTTLAQWPNPEPLVNNSIVAGVRDPSLIKRVSDGKYFLFGTNGNGTVHTADSLHGPWAYQPWGALEVEQTVVAPQVYYIPDEKTYYMYYCGTRGPQSTWWYNANIRVATSETMEAGTWKDFGLVDIPYNNQNVTKYSVGYNILDPSLLIIDPTDPINDELQQRRKRRDGVVSTETQYYLSFGSYESGIFQAVLEDPMRLQRSNKTLASEEYTINHLEWNSTAQHSTEGSFQWAWPVDGSGPVNYYLFFSSGQCCDFKDKPVNDSSDAYKIMVCRSDSPEGPFTDRDGKDCQSENGGTLLLGSHGSVYAPGGQGVMYDENLGGTVLYYHYLPSDPNSETLMPDLNYGDNDAYFGWNNMDWDLEGWPTLVETAKSDVIWPFKREEGQRRAVHKQW